MVAVAKLNQSLMYISKDQRSFAAFSGSCLEAHGSLWWLICKLSSSFGSIIVIQSLLSVLLRCHHHPAFPLMASH